MMNVDRRKPKPKLWREFTQHVKENDRVDAAREPDCDALASQIVRAQERAHGCFSARRFP